MSSTPLVSCVIPVYNAEKYLKQGIRSLLKQTYKNLEIILVDDRSTDGSWGICKEYAKRYPNIRVFRNRYNSGGPLRGRERGIKESLGEWITFMDCDDYVGREYIEHLVETTDKGRYDIAVTGYSRLFTDGRVESFLWDDYSQTRESRIASFYEHFLNRDFWTDPADTVGQNLVSAEVAKKTDLSGYPDRVWAEDTLMALSFLENSKKGVSFCDYHDFFWRQRPGSGSNGGFSNTADRPAFYRACYDIFSRNLSLPLVSVVVPVYKVEKYIGICVDSLLAQTYPNLEILLVDDKSPDSSGRIADKYAQTEARVRVIHKNKNEGLNMARATGFQESSGSYVMFVDSDDSLTEDCVRSSLTALIKNKADFARFGMVTYRDKADRDRKLAKPSIEREVLLDTKRDLFMTQFDQRMVLGEMPMFSMTVWGALYTRRLVSTLDWKDVNYRAYEDNIWTLRILDQTSRAIYISDVGYLYRYDDSIDGVLSKSITGNTYNGKPVGYLEGLDRIRQEHAFYNRKYKVGADAIIENETELMFMHRADKITRADLWGVEGNSRYLPVVLSIYQKRLGMTQQDVVTKDRHIQQLELDNTSLRAEVARLRTELESHLSIKRSARLTLGNIKRRILHK